jgi:hypothetical protein
LKRFARRSRQFGAGGLAAAGQFRIRSQADTWSNNADAENSLRVEKKFERTGRARRIPQPP